MWYLGVPVRRNEGPCLQLLYFTSGNRCRYVDHTMNPLRRRFRIFRQLRLTPFVECPHCHKLLQFKRRNRTVCTDPIPPEYAMVSAVTNAVNILACNEAKDIDHVATRFPIILAAVLFTGILLKVPSIIFWLLVICAALQLIGVLSWNLRF